MNLLEVKNICKTYGSGETAVKALKDVSFSVPKGEYVAVVGESGSGKSTLLNMIGALDTPTTGKVLIDGKDIFAMDERKLTVFRRRNIGFIFQAFNLVPELTVEQNIIFPVLLDYQKPDKKYLEELLAVLNLKERRNHLPSQLSGGQQQRVAIARALATNPKILLCDEATSALDPATTESILSLIKDINRRLGITAIIITHEMSVIEKICNQVAIISHGRIAETGSVEEVFFHPQTEEARQLVIPEALQDMPHSRLYRIIFNGRSSFEPVISNLVLECGAPVNIMFADTRDIGGTAFGQMVLQLPDNEEVVRRILAYADSKGLMLEEMKNV